MSADNFFSKVIDNPSMCQEIIREFFKDSFKNNPEYLQVMTEIVKTNIDYLYKNSESPIEKMFGSALVIALLMNDYMVLPRNAFFATLLKENEIPKEVRKGIAFYADVMKAQTTIFLAPQEKVNRKRIDLALWISLPGEKYLHAIAVECDGFEFHKKRFTEDRKKDREVKREGYEEVFRFSGSEIWNTPIEVSKEIIDWIKELENKYK